MTSSNQSFSWSFKKFICYLVLITFYFQTLWPSVCFAQIDFPLGSPWRTPYQNITFAVKHKKDPTTHREALHLQAYVEREPFDREGDHNPSRESFSGSSSMPFSSHSSSTASSRSFSPQDAQGKVSSSKTILLNRILDIQTHQDIRLYGGLYQSLALREEGVVWQFEGLTFVADWQGSLLITGQSTMRHLLRVKSSKELLLDGLQADQVVAKGSKVILDGKNTTLERLDVWAKKNAQSTAGQVVIDPAAQVFIKHLSVHQGNLDQQGQLYVENHLQYTQTIKNKGQLVFGKDAIINGQGTFLNYGDVQGEAYTLNSKQLKTFAVSPHNSKASTLTATKKLTVNSDSLTHAGILNAPFLDLNVEDKLTTAKGSQIESADFTLKSQGQVEHQGTIKAARSSLTADTVKTSSDSVILGNSLYTTLQQQWDHQGKLVTGYWIDKSPPKSFLNNQGSILSRKGTKITGKFRNLNKGNADLAKITFSEKYSFFRTLTNEGHLTLRNVQSLGQPPYRVSSINIHNKKGATLSFIDCGTVETKESFIAHSGMSPLNNHSLPTTTAKTKAAAPSAALPQARLMVGNVTNEGTIRFSNGAYQIDGTFTNKAQAVHEVSDLQNLWVRDFINEGRVESLSDYRVDQRLGVFKKLGHLVVKSLFRRFGKNNSKGQLITQLTKQALGNNSRGFTSWTHTGHIEANEWIDESEAGISLRNEGTLLIHKKTTLNNNFKNEEKGTADLAGLTILPSSSVFGSRNFNNEGTLILRQVKSLGTAKTTVFNKNKAKLTFLDCGYGKPQQALQTAGTYQYLEQDNQPGGLSFNTIYNWGTIGFGGGDYHIDYFKNYGIHEVLAGHHIHAEDFNNKGETRAQVPEYIIDQTNGLFTRLGKINSQGDVTLKVSDKHDLSEVLFNPDNQFNLKGKLILQGYNLTVPVGQWTLSIPIYLHLQGILKILGRWTTNDLTAQIGDYTEIGQANQWGALQVKGRLDFVSGGYIDNRNGQIEIQKSAKIKSKNGYIYIGEHPGSYAAYGKSFILGHEDLEIDSAHEIHNICGDIASYGPMTLRAKGKIYNLSSRTQSYGSLSIHTPVLHNHRPGLVAFEQSGTRGMIRETGYRSMGEQSMIYSAEYLYLDVQDIENLASSIQTHGIIMNGRVKVVDVTQPQNSFRSFINQSYNGPSDNYLIFGRFVNKPPCSIAPIYQPAIITSSTGINLNFNHMTLTGGAMAGAFIHLMGQYLEQTWSQSSTSKPTQSLTTRFSLYPYLSQWIGASLTYQTPSISPKVAFGSALSRHTTVPFEELTFVVDDIHQFDPMRDFTTYRLMMNRQVMGMVYATAMNQLFHRGGMFAHQSGDKQVKALLRQTKKVFGGHQVITKQQADQVLQHALTIQLQTINGEQMWTPHLMPGLSERDHRLASKDGVFNATDTDLNMEMKERLDLHGTTASAKGKLKGKAKVVDFSSATERQGNSENYTTHLHQTILEGENIEIDGQDHVQLAATKTQSGKGGTHLISQGTLHDGLVALTHHQTIPEEGGQTTIHTVNQAVSQHDSEGPFNQYAMGGSLTIDGHQVKGSSIHLHGQGGVDNRNVTYTTEIHTEIREKGGMFESDHVIKEHSFTATSQGSRYEADTPVLISTGVGQTIRLVDVTVIVPEELKVSAELLAPGGAIQLLAGINQYTLSRFEKESDGIYTTTTQSGSQSQTYTPCSFSSGVKINGHVIDIQQIKDQTLVWVDKIIKDENAVLRIHDLTPLYQSYHHEHSSLNPAVAAVVALAVTAVLCTTGVGAGAGNVIATGLVGSTSPAFAVISTMGAAAFTATASQAATALIAHQGDIGKAIKDVTASNSLKSIAISTASAGITRGLAQKFNIKFVPGTANTLPEHFQKETLRQSVTAGLRVATGSDPKQVLDQAIRGTIAGVAGGLMANQIGEMKQDGEISATTHKLLHGVAGAVGGAILNQGKNIADSMIAGAMGAITAEVVAEAMGDSKTVIAQRVQAKAIEQGIDLNDQEALNSLIVNEMAKTISISTLGAGIAALLAGVDVDTAAQTGTTAVENNIFWKKAFDILASIVSKAGTQSVKTAAKEEAKQIAKQTVKEESKKLPKDLKNYIREVESKTGSKVCDKQKDMLAQDLRQNKYMKLTPEQKAAHTKQYEKVKDRIISEWETQTEKQWPIEDILNPRTGLLEPKKYQAHHINPQQMGGKHEWWNIFPAYKEAHTGQGGIHSAGSALNKILKEVNKQ